MDEIKYFSETFDYMYLDEHYGNWRVPDKNDKGDRSWEKGMPAYVKKWGR